MIDELSARFRNAPYHDDVGMNLDSVTEGGACVRVPFRKRNANPGDALHGGVYASVIEAAAEVAAWTAIPPTETTEAGPLDLDVRYLAAALGCEVVARARVLRRGKELVHVETDVLAIADDGGERPVAKGLVLYRVFDTAAAPRAAERQLAMDLDRSRVADGDVIEHGELMVSTPFMARREMKIRRMIAGASTLELPAVERNTDHDGRLHEGALAALADSTGAMACWSLAGLDFSFKASTAGLYVSYHAPLHGEAALAGARVLRRNNEMYAAEVVICGARSATVAAAGTVVYRIVVPD